MADICDLCGNIVRSDDHVIAAGVTGVPSTGTFLVVDGEVRRVDESWREEAAPSDERWVVYVEPRKK